MNRPRLGVYSARPGFALDVINTWQTVTIVVFYGQSPGKPQSGRRPTRLPTAERSPRFPVSIPDAPRPASATCPPDPLRTGIRGAQGDRILMKQQVPGAACRHEVRAAIPPTVVSGTRQRQAKSGPSPVDDQPKTQLPPVGAVELAVRASPASGRPAAGSGRRSAGMRAGPVKT